MVLYIKLDFLTQTTHTKTNSKNVEKIFCHNVPVNSQYFQGTMFYRKSSRQLAFLLPPY